MNFSVIIPMYNCEKYIENCIKSLINQDLNSRDYEIIIVNDGSVDNSKSIVENYKKKFNNIKLINTTNGGQARARNIGIENASGKYLFFVDADDYIAEYSINEILNLAIKDKLQMVFFDIKRVKNDSYKKCFYKDKKIDKVVTGVEYFSKNNVNNGPWHYFISKEFIGYNNIRFAEGRYCEDGLFLIDCIFKSERVSYSKTDIYRYVERVGSTTTKKSKNHSIKLINDFLYAIEYINNYYEFAVKSYYPNNFIEKIKSRRNSYIFFMQARMIKNKIGYKESIKILNKLKKINCYKYERPLIDEYPKMKYTLIHCMFNSFIFKFFC